MNVFLLTLISVLTVTFLPGLFWQSVVIVFILLFTVTRKQAGEIFKMAVKFWPIVAITLLFHMVIRFDDAPYLAAFSKWSLWQSSLFFSLRNINLILLMSHILYFLTKKDITSELLILDHSLTGRRVILSKIIQPLIIGLRYYDTIRREYQSMRQLHRILGIEQKGKYLNRVHYYSGIVLPLVLTAMERSEQMGIALTTRAYPPQRR